MVVFFLRWVGRLALNGQHHGSDVGVLVGEGSFWQFLPGGRQWLELRRLAWTVRADGNQQPALVAHETGIPSRGREEIAAIYG